MYFAKFPRFLMRVDGEQRIITDFLVRVGVGKQYRNLSVLLMPYVVTDGQRAEDIAHRFYKNPEYHWVIYLLNDIVDPRKDWPKSTRETLAYTQLKYANINAVHHYFLVADEAIILDSTQLGSYASEDYGSVTNYEYEVEENDKRRNIKLLHPKYLGELVNNLNNTLR